MQLPGPHLPEAGNPSQRRLHPVPRRVPYGPRVRSEHAEGAVRLGAEDSRAGRVLGWPLAVGVGLVALPLVYALCTHVWLASGSVPSAAALVVGMSTAFAAMMLPGGALFLLVTHDRRGWGTGLASATLTVVAGSAVIAWVCLWFAIANPVLGFVVYGVMYLASICVITDLARTELRRLVMVAGVLGVGLAACVTLSAVFYAHGGLAVATEIGSTRTFATSDNIIPQYWVLRIEHDQDLRSPGLGWPLADRPPVQAGLVFPLESLSAATGGNAEVAYQLPAVALQGLAVTAVAVLVTQLGFTRRRRLAALLLVVMTPFVAYNTIFVWPKLLAAAFLLLAVAALFEDGDAIRGSTWLLVGAAVSLSLLSHPGSSFSLTVLAVVLVALWRRRVAFGPWLGALFALFAVLLPWGLYRLVYDHSTSWLLKQHLAGVIDHRDHRGVLQSIVDQYRSLGVSGWIRNRLDNLRDLVWRPGRTHLPSSWTGRFLTLGTYSPLWSGGLLLLAAPLLFARRLPRNVRLMAVAGLAATLVWTVIEFGKPAADAVTHQGPYAAFLLDRRRARRRRGPIASPMGVGRRRLPADRHLVVAHLRARELGPLPRHPEVRGPPLSERHRPRRPGRASPARLGALAFATFVVITLRLEPSPPDAARHGWANLGQLYGRE